MIKVSLRLGGLAASASPEQMSALDAYGDKIGLAFQIADDLLDVCGEEAKTGKRVGKDGSQGKLTYPGWVGADRSLQMARDLCRGACAALHPLGTGAQRLDQLARFIVERDR
jgi:geranylgeranyl pyrophosphate synthase